jgi:hypothetical protein
VTTEPTPPQAGSEATPKSPVDLVQWLTEQIDLDEAHAQKDLWALDRSTPGRWEAHYGHNLPYSLLKGEGGVEIARFTAGTVPLPDGADDLHAADILLVVRLVRKARERADRVLRQVAAYRRILSRHEPYEGRCTHCMEWCNCSDSSPEECPHGNLPSPCPDLLDLASIFAGRPGFDPSWTVE